MAGATERMTEERPLLRVDSATGELFERFYELRVISGPDAGATCALRHRMVVGTDGKADWTLKDAQVSRLHVELVPTAEGVFVRDLKSTNGTTLGGARIEEALVVDREAQLRLGKTVIRIAMRDAAAEASPELSSFGEAVSDNPEMRRLFGALARAAQSDSTVLLLGETGTGKDVLARAVKDASPRRDKPMVVIDCGGTSTSLIDSELFGHVKGSFTGAVADRWGAFFEAQGGTVFLDEVGELPPEVQPKLLRVLEAGTAKRTGEDKPRTVDVRVIAATHRNLAEEVAAGRFRKDLFFRLSVVSVTVPPLRARPEDVGLLVRHFLAQSGNAQLEIPAEALAQLVAYPWPGNIRELRNVIDRALAGMGFDVPKEEVSATARSASNLHLPYKDAKDQLIDEFSRAYFADLSERCGGNITRMAERAGIARHYLRDLLRRYGLRPGDEEA